MIQVKQCSKTFKRLKSGALGFLSYQPENAFTRENQDPSWEPQLPGGTKIPSGLQPPRTGFGLPDFNDLTDFTSLFYKVKLSVAGDPAQADSNWWSIKQVNPLCTYVFPLSLDPPPAKYWIKVGLIQVQKERIKEECCFNEDSKAMCIIKSRIIKERRNSSVWLRVHLSESADTNARTDTQEADKHAFFLFS